MIHQVNNPGEWIKIKTYLQEIIVNGNRKDVAFVTSIHDKFQQTGRISDKQLSCVMQIWLRVKDSIDKRNLKAG